MCNHTSLIGLGLIAALSVGAAAQQRPSIRLVPQPQPTVTFVAPWKVDNASDGKTKVIGTVIDVRQTAVKGATVRLRDLRTGAVLAETKTDDQGAYEFEAEPGTFVVEMVLADGYVVGLSNAGTVARFETLQTVVQLPGRWDNVTQNVIAITDATGYLGMTSAATMTSTTVTIASDQSIPVMNPGEPVSPR